MNRLIVGLAATAMLVGAGSVNADFLVTKRDASAVYNWGPLIETTLFHSTKSNDADYNVSEGASHAWVAEHYDDYFARFEPGSGSGLDQKYSLGSSGRTHYSYPKHITVFDGDVFVMSRNDATIHRYDTNGSELAQVDTDAYRGQGMATDGTNLYVSLWNGSNSYFHVYDSSLALLDTVDNPTGMGTRKNIFDFAYDSASGKYFGLAANSEGGTGTRSNTVLEFTMGGGVTSSHTLPFEADGIGQFNNTIPEPSTVILLATGALGLLTCTWRRRR